MESQVEGSPCLLRDWREGMLLRVKLLRGFCNCEQPANQSMQRTALRAAADAER